MIVLTSSVTYPLIDYYLFDDCKDMRSRLASSQYCNGEICRYLHLNYMKSIRSGAVQRSVR